MQGRAAILFLMLAFAGAPVTAEEDWAALHVYAQRDADLAARGHVAHRVVFMGDSITEGWDRDHQTIFASPLRINRGISGQTTSQMLARFRQDVIALEPETVVLLGGTNDIAGNGGPVSDAVLRGNIQSMVELAKAHGVRVILLSVPPADRFWWATDVHPAARIRQHNAWAKAYADSVGARFVDIHTPLSTPEGAMAPAYSGDGVHPNAAGYAVIERTLAMKDGEK